MPVAVYYTLVALLALGVLLGIYLMSKVKTSVFGNGFSALCMLLAIILTLVQYKILNVWVLYPCMLIGGVIGIVWAYKVKMIQMPQLVALFNGVGGLASALVAMISMLGIMTGDSVVNPFVMVTACLALAVGMITFIGSLIAAGKLHKVLPQKPVIVKGHQTISIIFLLLTLASIIMSAFYKVIPGWASMVLCFVVSTVFGTFFALRVGGADMPVVISLLNSLSGVAAGITGMAISDYLLVAIGGIVGASGLLLTQIMCKSMNRKLVNILFGIKAKVVAKQPEKAVENKAVEVKEEVKEEIKEKKVTDVDILKNAKEVIIVPGYGMALSQAQHTVKQLANKLQSNGTVVKYAIHPVAGRMPGHMNVLLCEADVDYEDLYQMDDINDEFANADCVIVIGANDVINPAAREAEGTPIYGMPVLNVDKAKYVIICNYDLKPGYAGVDNPLYHREEGVTLRLGNAAETVQQLITDLDKAPSEETVNEVATKAITDADILNNAKEVIIVPGYGMALAQAQHTVKQLADKLVSQGTVVKYAIHPVAGRMPGHMNVLLCEADVNYEDLYQMDDINDDFVNADAVVVVGANDVINPAAREAEGTPIYGMPVLNVDKAKFVIVCNYDLKPGYAGVDNPLYSRSEGVSLRLGNAAETVQQLITDMDKKPESKKAEDVKVEKVSDADILNNASEVIIVPGYGMALAQAQHTVKQLADKLSSRGVKVKYAIHPVAGRMPGHMNVLLCEADVDYEDLYQMDDINDDFVNADAVVVIGANDVINPAAREAEGTPIYGMPVLNVDKAKYVIVCNYDLKPGYAGVDNPLYSKAEGVSLRLGDASKTVQELISELDSAPQDKTVSEPTEAPKKTEIDYLNDAKEVIIVPGYGMALSQAQHTVKQLADKLVAKGKVVKYAIHPVAGRMPGHMNVLLCEADVDYEDLYQMDDINDEFANADCVIVIGANDVINPAAREAEGTPIYGMPVLNVDKAKHIIICNYDLKPGYAGVENPLYTNSEKVTLLLGNAADTVAQLISKLN